MLNDNFFRTPESERERVRKLKERGSRESRLILTIGSLTCILCGSISYYKDADKGLASINGIGYGLISVLLTVLGHGIKCALEDLFSDDPVTVREATEKLKQFWGKLEKDGNRYQKVYASQIDRHRDLSRYATNYSDKKHHNEMANALHADWLLERDKPRCALS